MLYEPIREERLCIRQSLCLERVFQEAVEATHVGVARSSTYLTLRGACTGR